MELFIRRVYEGETYTIGHLYVNGTYFCDTLEPPVRRLPARCEYTERGAVCRCKEKVWGHTAIPAGEYPVAVTYSQKFRARMMRVLKVPHFSGILLHQGNTVKDTQGCILVGKNTVKGKLAVSLLTMRQLRSMVWKALAVERVRLKIAGPLLLTAAYSGEPVAVDPVKELPPVYAFRRRLLGYLTGWGDALTERLVAQRLAAQCLAPG